MSLIGITWKSHSTADFQCATGWPWPGHFYFPCFHYPSAKWGGGETPKICRNLPMRTVRALGNTSNKKEAAEMLPGRQNGWWAAWWVQVVASSRRSPVDASAPNRSQSCHDLWGLKALRGLCTSPVSPVAPPRSGNFPGLAPLVGLFLCMCVKALSPVTSCTVMYLLD